MVGESREKGTRASGGGSPGLDADGGTESVEWMKQGYGSGQVIRGRDKVTKESQRR